MEDAQERYARFTGELEQLFEHHVRPGSGLTHYGLAQPDGDGFHYDLRDEPAFVLPDTDGVVAAASEAAPDDLEMAEGLIDAIERYHAAHDAIAVDGRLSWDHLVHEDSQESWVAAFLADPSYQAMRQALNDLWRLYP